METLDITYRIIPIIIGRYLWRLMCRIVLGQLIIFPR